MSLSLSLHKVYDLNFSVPLWPLWYYVKNHSYKLKLLSKRYSNGFINLTTSIEEFSGELCFYSRQSPSSDFWILSWLELEVIWVILHGVSPVILRFSVKYPLWVCLSSFYYCWFFGTFCGFFFLCFWFGCGFGVLGASPTSCKCFNPISLLSSLQCFVWVVQHSPK